MTKKRAKQQLAGKAATGTKKPRASAAASTGDPATDSFLAWCATVGIKHPKCTIGVLPGTGRGVIATQDIQHGEVVVEVPDDAVLMVETCRIGDSLEEAGLSKAEASDALLEVQGLVLAVATEKAAGKRSQWAPYLAFIPDDLSHLPMYWSDAEQRELRGTAALDKMEGRVQTPADAPTQVRMLWEEIAEPFFQENPQCKVPKGDKSWALYQWATAAVSSYSFILGDDHYQAMVPFWDALNHVTGAVNVRLNHVEGRRGGQGKLQMIATRDISKGEEVVNNYGELSQAELLRAYGYVERHDDSNKYAHVQAPLRFVLQACYSAVLSQRGVHDAPGKDNPDTQGANEEGSHSDDGSDSDGASEWGLDTDSEDPHNDNNHDNKNDNNRDTNNDNSHGSDRGKEQQTAGPSSNGNTAHNASEPQHPSQRSPSEPTQPTSSAPSEGMGYESSHEDASVREGAARVDSVRLSDIKRRVRGLPGRLRFLKRTSLLAKNNVFKVYMPTSDGDRPGTLALAEAVRVLLLPYPVFTRLRSAIRTQLHTAVTTTGLVATPFNSNPDVGADAVTAAEAADVLRVLRCVAQHMLSRYTCSLQADDAQIQQWVAEAGSVGAWLASHKEDRGVCRRAAAVLARAPEKRCLHALDTLWADGGCQQGLRAMVGEWWARPRWGSDSDSDSDAGSESSSDSEGESGSSSGSDGGSEGKPRDAKGSQQGRKAKGSKAGKRQDGAGSGHAAAGKGAGAGSAQNGAKSSEPAFAFNFTL